MSPDFLLLEPAASEAVGYSLKTYALWLVVSGCQSTSLAPNAVGRVCHLCPRCLSWSVIGPHCLLGVPCTSSSQSSLPEGVWAWGTPPWSTGGVSSPGAQRMQCGHFPKAEAGCGYQSHEAGKRVLLPKHQMPVSSIVCSDVIFHRSTTKGNTHRECHWLMWLWEIWVLFCVFPPRWVCTEAQIAPLPHCIERKEGKEEGKEEQSWGRNTRKDTCLVSAPKMC